MGKKEGKKSLQSSTWNLQVCRWPCRIVCLYARFSAGSGVQVSSVPVYSKYSLRTCILV